MTNKPKKIEISDPKLQQISTINSSIIIDYVRKFLGESYFPNLFHNILNEPSKQYYYLDSPIDLNFFESGDRWIPNEISLQMFENLHNMGVELFDVGNYSVNHSGKLNHIAILSLLHVMGPSKTVRQVSKINSMFNRTKDIQLLKFNNSGGQIKLLYKTGIKHTERVTEYNMGVYVGVLKQIGYENVQVDCDEENFASERPYTLLTFKWSNETFWHRLKWVAGLYVTQFMAKVYMMSHHSINKYHNNIINHFHTEIRKKEKALDDKEALFHLLQQERVNKEEMLKKKITEKTKELEEKKELLKHEIKLKNEQFRNITHELKTPVMLVKSPLSELYTCEQLSFKQTETVKVALQNMERLESFINKIAEIEKIKSTINFHNQWFEIAGEVQNITQPIVYQAMTEKQIEVNIEYPKDLIIKFNQEYLNLIITNILGNAIKYSYHQGIITFHIKVLNDNEIHFVCTDNGPGIPSPEINHVFTKYYRCQKTQSTEGTGLGLYIVKQLVDKLNGSIIVESIPEEQTVFTIHLPMEIDYKKTNQARNTLGRDSIKPVRNAKLDKQYTIVVIEDNTDLNNYLINSLSDSLYCIGADNGISGLEKIRYHRPDLIITDLQMPEMTGEELIQRVKNDPLIQHIPVIVLTSANHKKFNSKLVSQISDYIEKPITIELLKSKVNNQLKQIAVTGKANVFVIEQITEFNKTLSQEEIQWINLVNDILVNNYRDLDFRVNDLAEKLNLTPKTLQRKLSNIVTSTPHNLLKNTRLFFARQMLLNSSNPIGKVAYLCGFRSESTFTNAFKNRHLVSPTEFLKNIS